MLLHCIVILLKGCWHIDVNTCVRSETCIGKERSKLSTDLPSMNAPVAHVTTPSIASAFFVTVVLKDSFHCKK